MYIFLPLVKFSKDVDLDLLYEILFYIKSLSRCDYRITASKISGNKSLENQMEGKSLDLSKYVYITAIALRNSKIYLGQLQSYKHICLGPGFYVLSAFQGFGCCRLSKPVI